jgi:hypothetical protein
VCHRTCPVHQRTRNSNSLPSGISRGVSAKIHRTVRCTPDMSGAPRKSGLRNSPAPGFHFSCSAIIHRTVRCNSGATAISVPTATCDALNARCARRGQARPCWRTGHPTVRVRCATGHPGGPRSQCSNGRNPTALVTWLSHRTCPVCTGLSDVHRTVRCAIEQTASPNG